MKKQNQNRQNFAEKTKQLVFLDRCLEDCKNTGKKPFENSSIEEGCSLYAFHRSSRLMADMTFLRPKY